MENFDNIFTEYQNKYDFNAKLKKLTKKIIIYNLSRQYDNPKLKVELEACQNINQMINAIRFTLKPEIIKKRDRKESKQFKKELDLIVQITRSPKR